MCGVTQILSQNIFCLRTDSFQCCSSCEFQFVDSPFPSSLLPKQRDDVDLKNSQLSNDEIAKQKMIFPFVTSWGEKMQSSQFFPMFMSSSSFIFQDSVLLN